MALENKLADLLANEGVKELPLELIEYMHDVSNVEIKRRSADRRRETSSLGDCYVYDSDSEPGNAAYAKIIDIDSNGVRWCISFEPSSVSPNGAHLVMCGVQKAETFMVERVISSAAFEAQLAQFIDTIKKMAEIRIPKTKG